MPGLQENNYEKNDEFTITYLYLWLGRMWVKL